MADALLLFAHGARDPRWAEPFERIAARIRSLAPELRVDLAFLELMTPSLADAAAGLAAAGFGRVDIVPLFLGAGGHVRKDLPPLVEALRRTHAGICWRLHAPIGEDEAVIDAIGAVALAMARRAPPME